MKCGTEGHVSAVTSVKDWSTELKYRDVIVKLLLQITHLKPEQKMCCKFILSFSVFI